VPKKEFKEFHVVHAVPLDKNDIFPVVILRNKTSPLPGWRLNKAQYDFIISMYEVVKEKE
jgi:hypothetical protein